MRLPELLQRQATQLLDKFCRERVPCSRFQSVKLDYRVSDNHVTLFELYLDPRSAEDWLRTPIARFSYTPELNQWALYALDPRQRWQLYLGIKPSLNLSRLIRGLDEDPSGIFWR